LETEKRRKLNLLTYRGSKLLGGDYEKY